MLTTKRLLKPCFTLMMAAAVLTGCDRIKSITNKVKDTREATANTASAVAALQPDPVKTLDATTYAEFTSQKNKLVIVDFYADWCGPCKKMGPVLEKAVAAHPGAVALGKVNIDQAKPLAAENRVSSIPDVRFFRDGKEVDKLVGFPGESAMLAKIAALSKNIVPAPAATAPDGSPAKPATPSEPKIQPMKKDWLPPGIQKR